MYCRSAAGIAAVWIAAIIGGVSAGGAGAADLPADGVAAQPPDLRAPFSEREIARPEGPDRDAIWNRTLGERAIEAGHYYLAELFLRSALADVGDDAVERSRSELALSTTLIAQSKRDQAAQVLETFSGERGSAWWLRRAMLDFQEEDFAALDESLAQVNPILLPEADLAWYYFLRAASLARAGQTAQADVAFEDALSRSTSEATRSWVRVAHWQARLNVGEATEELLASIAEQTRLFQNQVRGFVTTMQYAVTLDRLGRGAEAVQVLLRQSRSLPASEPELRDQTLLLLGLIADPQSAEGNRALRELLEQGTNPDWQRSALQLLSARTPPEGGPAASVFQVLLNALLARQPSHPLEADLLLYRAELALRSNGYQAAEDDAQRLLTRYPGSALATEARALLASSAWQQRRFRTAASQLEEIRSVLPPGVERARLSVLLGECYYRAGMAVGTAEDFRNAADAYQTAQEEIVQLEAETPGAPSRVGASLGDVFFQRVLSLLRAGNLDDAQALLDTAAAIGVDVESRWQAEWNLVRFYELHQRGSDALRRVESPGVAAGASPELRLRFLWLSAQLTVESDHPEDTEGRVARLQQFLLGEGAEIDAAVRARVSAGAALLRAQAQLELGNYAAGLQGIEELRRTYPGSDAAEHSYVVQARYLAENNQLVEAMRFFRLLVERHPQSPYAPMALLEAAELATRQGQDAYLKQASDLLRQLADNYPDDPYVFMAWLRRADIFRQLNEFSAAEEIYAHLENDYRNHPGWLVARLRLAETQLAQVSADPAKFDPAITRLDLLWNLSSASADLRLEAGFILANAWQNRGEPDRAAKAYWEIYNRFLGSPDADINQLGAKGARWLARSLFALAEIEQAGGRIASARRAYEAVLRHRLPFEAIARARITNLQSGG